MTDDRSDRGDGRDAKGRWVKDVCGNLNGRPTQEPDLDYGDFFNFSQVPTEITVDGKRVKMSRKEVLLLTMYKDAINGRVSMQKYLFEKMMEAELARESILMIAQQIIHEFENDPKTLTREIADLLQAIPGSLSGPRSKIRNRTRKRGER